MKTTLNLAITLIVFLISTGLSLASDNQQTKRYTYLENDGISVFYETQDRDTYRKLLPDIFDMPDQLTVYSFITDFYKMDARTQPYKEASIFLLAKYKGREGWHCVFMPVTSQESRIVGIRRLGLPKTMGDIEFSRNGPLYSANAMIEGRGSMSLNLDTQNYTLSNEERRWVETLSILPKLSIRSGSVIKVGGMRRRSIIDTVNAFPDRMTLKGGKVKINHQPPAANGSEVHPLNLVPSKILAAYYLHNTIPFRLGGKKVSN